MAGENVVGREPIQIIHIKQKSCSNVFGSSPCTASGTADQKCYNTYPTCQNKDNYAATTLDLYFTKANLNHEVLDTAGGSPLYLIPSLVSASTAPTVINVGGSNRNVSPLGLRAVLNVVFQDHPHSGRVVDPYQAGRTFDANARGSFWSKWAVRNKYHKGSDILIYDGYVGQALDEMTSRQYIIDKLSGPSSSGGVRIVAKDVLSKVIARKSMAPAASKGELLSDIDAVVTSVVATGALIADYATTGTIAIGDEMMTYSGRVQTTSDTVTFTITLRGSDGTTARTHEAEDTVQAVLEYTSEKAWDVVQDLLVNYAGIDTALIPITDWDLEGSTYLPSFTITTKVPDPTPVETLVAEITEQSLFYIWWHEVDKEIKMRAIRGVDVEPPLFDDGVNIVSGSFKIKEVPERRISQVWTNYGVVSPIENLTKIKNYKTSELLADLDAESTNEYDEPSIKNVYSRWITDRNVVLDFNTKTLNRFRDTPYEVTLQVDAKDRANWTGDTVRLSHFAIIDQHGERVITNWRIMSAEAIVPGEVVEYTLDNATLEGVIVVYMDAGDPDYVGDGTDQFNGAWYAGADGLHSNGDAGPTYA